MREILKERVQMSGVGPGLSGLSGRPSPIQADPTQCKALASGWKISRRVVIIYFNEV